MPVPLSARRRSRLLLPLLLAITLLPLAVSPAALPVERAAAAGPLDWPQWGQNPQHTGQSAATGQSPATTLADLVFDPFVVGEQQQAGGDLLAHHPVPLIRGNDVFMMQQGGTFTPCGSSTPPQSSLAARTGRALTASLTGSGAPWRPRVTPTCGSWNTKIWNMQRLSWQNGALQPVWTFASDWKPEPNGAGLAGWEPLFQSVLTADGLWVPGLGGSVHLVDPATGTGTARVMPFGGTLDPNTYVASGLAADAGGNVYYTAIALDPSDPWAAGSNPPDVRGAWLVRVKPNRSFDTVPYSVLVQNPPTSCLGTFSGGDPLPWPPSPTAQPPSAPCLSQRPAINATPAIGADGTIFVTSRAHRLAALAYGYVVAVKPDTLTPKWAASLRGHLADGCGVSLPIGGPSGCRAGTTVGVDPATNQPGAGLVIDLSSASPVALPDGGVLYGTYGDYNGARGHTFKFDTNGTFQGAYDFGWDSTPAVYQHHGTYSIVTKDNHYAVGSYCGDPTWCPVSGDGPYYITQLSANLAIEWQFKSTNTQSCHRNQDGTIACTNDHPGGFEWCINAPAVDAAGVVYVNSEDGNVYRILQGGQDGGHRFLQLAIGAAYTPLAIGPDGVLYSQNAGHLIALGQTAPAPAPAGGLKLVPPTRVLDTRAAPFGPIGTNGDGTAVQAGPVAANQTRRFRLAGQTFGTVTLPSDVTGVLVNLTIVQPAASGGFVTLFPADLAAPPNASTVNPSTGIAASFWATGLPNGAVANAGTLGVFSNGAPRDLLIDLIGYYR